MAQDRIPMQITVSTFNSGGWLCNPLSEGLKGFIPNSQVLDPPQNKSQLIGKNLEVIVTEVDPASKRLVLSEQEAWKDKYLKTGDLVNGKIDREHYRGLLVSLGHGILGLLDRTSNNLEGLEVGENVDVRIESKEGSRISLAFGNQHTAKSEQILADNPLIIGGKLFMSKRLLPSVEWLPDSELAVLSCLDQHRGETVPYRLLLHKSKISNGSIEDLRGIVHQLRCYNPLGDMITTERGVGYRLEVPKG